MIPVRSLETVFFFFLLELKCDKSPPQENQLSAYQTSETPQL